MIEIKNLTFRYNRSAYVLKDLNLSIKKGEFVTILGHNGSGKSTLAKLLIGLLEAETGTIAIDGQELNIENVYEIRKKIGIVFQNPDNQFVGVTVLDDIAFGLENRQMKQKEMLDIIDEHSKLVGMEDFLSRNPESLSGGQKQRVAIAGVLAMNPDIIIFDEATSMLDPAGVKEVIDIIKSLKGKKTVILITHNLQEAIFSDRVIVMKSGKIEIDGPPEVVFTKQELLEGASLRLLPNMQLKNMLSMGDKNKEQLEKIEELLWEYTFKK